MTYAPAIVLLAWSVLWEIGLRGDVVIVVALVATFVAIAAHIVHVRR